MDASGGTGTLAITTQPECRWDAAASVNWISALSPASGQGATDLTFRVAANDGSSSREGMIAVNGEQARVSQRAPCRYDVAPATQNIGSSGGYGTATITTSAECAWTAAADVNWIALTSPETGSGSGTVTFAVRQNDGAQRTGSITIGGQRSSVTQASSPLPQPPAPSPPSPPTPPPPSDCTYGISPTSANVTGNDGGGTVSVMTNLLTCTWAASSNASWLTVESGTRTGSGSLSYRVGLNLGPARTGTLTIAGRTFTVVQASACTYGISPTSDNVTANDGAGSVNVTTSLAACAWSVSSNASWLTVETGTRTGSGSVTYRVGFNLGVPRTGTLTIAGHTFTVIQASISGVAR
jgi:VCBS repeat-containing protein